MKKWRLNRLCSLSLILMILFFTVPSTVHASGSDRASGLANLLLDAFGLSKIIGTVEIVKAGYMNAYKSNDTKSGIVFRAHHGERYLCKYETDDGWYGIQFIEGTIGYVLQKDTALERGVTDPPNFSTPDADNLFKIRTIKKATVYSQPRISAQSRRESPDSTTTFYIDSGKEFNAFGKTTRENKDWYVFCDGNMGYFNVPEIVWVLAADCEVLEGDPDANIIPSWWYD